MRLGREARALHFCTSVHTCGWVHRRAYVHMGTKVCIHMAMMLSNPHSATELARHDCIPVVVVVWACTLSRQVPHLDNKESFRKLPGTITRRRWAI